MDRLDADDGRRAADQPGTADRASAAHRPDGADRPNRNVARGEATRGQLIAIATRMFAERGYEDTSIEAVLREAGVSRGSLYHHFPSKEALFEAVAEEVETSVGAQTLAAASGAEGPVEALRAGFLAWIRLAGDPVVRRILLIDGPSVFGWEHWRAMEEHHALGLIRAGLQIIADEGKTRPELVGTLAHVLLASVNEVALLVARSDDKEAAMQAGAETIDELLQRLFDLPARDRSEPQWDEPGLSLRSSAVKPGFHFVLGRLARDARWPVLTSSGRGSGGPGPSRCAGAGTRTGPRSRLPRLRAG
jgi:AcrR family transcriptional regulator